MPFQTPSRNGLIILTLVGLCLAAPVTSARAAKTSTDKGSAPTYHVKSGDSLDRIAKKTGTTVAELQRLNQLSSSTLQIGQSLRLPAAKPRKNAAKPAATASGSNAPTKPVAQTTLTHQVRKGESLYRIARRYKLKVSDLQAWNQLSATALKPGQKLRLSEPSPTRAMAAIEATDSGPPPTVLTHTVTKGENLYKIARNRGVSVEELVRINQLSNNRLRVGQQLLLGQAPADAGEAAPSPVISAESVAVDSAPAPAPSDSAEGAAGPAPTEEEPALLTAADTDPERLARAIGKLRDLPYRFGGNGRNGIDCSGFVQRVFREFAINLPRSAREQYLRGTPVEKNQLRQGDLVFFRTYAKFPSHVGIYLGDNKMVHASTRSRKVVISDITQAYYKKRYIGAKRLVGQAPEGFRIDQVRDLLEEETAAEDKSLGMTGRTTPVAARAALTPG